MRCCFIELDHCDLRKPKNTQNLVILKQSSLIKASTVLCHKARWPFALITIYIYPITKNPSTLPFSVNFSPLLFLDNWTCVFCHRALICVSVLNTMCQIRPIFGYLGNCVKMRKQEDAVFYACLFSLRVLNQQAKSIVTATISPFTKYHVCSFEANVNAGLTIMTIQIKNTTIKPIQTSSM